MLAEDTVEACILAGGRSLRMGRDKSRMLLKGRSLLSYARTAAKQAGLSVRVIRRDLVPACGPLGGIYTALLTSKHQAIVFLSCDMPLVDAPLLAELRSRLTPEIQAIFVLGEQYGFPFILRRTVVGAVESLLISQQFSLQSLARKVNAVALSLMPDQQFKLFNVNTPLEYRALGKLSPP